ncbi:hypothetical protein I7I53_11633 [Histoplasma capsulatum var. duboisii H88]|uniref:Uncharacterized protein n=1 Tax=Ajellomyces capsulatus (strain H88) TaxID=544711 RepID=A0A8A1LUI2_AJEC8|nr:hypothetical protein I7I53_11633 [Histoplasma capsulatum var. duboisii H88]
MGVGEWTTETFKVIREHSSRPCLMLPAESGAIERSKLWNCETDREYQTIEKQQQFNIRHICTSKKGKKKTNTAANKYTHS